MIRKSLFLNLVLAMIVFLQTTLFSYIMIYNTKPDLALVVLLFIAIYHGSNTAQVTGFISGLLEDFLSLAPLGFHALIKTLIGFFLGLLKGKIDNRSIIFPIILIPVVTLFKYIALYLFGMLFTISMDIRVFISKTFYIEIAYNLVLGILLYLLLKIFNRNEDDRVNYRYE